MSEIINEPIHKKLYRTLKESIIKGEYKYGDKFISERDAGVKYEVSRVTANKAITALISEGILEYKKGVGTFVKYKPLPFDIKKLLTFTGKSEAKGVEVTFDILEFRKIKEKDIPADAARHLNDKNEDVYYIRRAGHAGKRTMIYERIYLRKSGFKNFDEKQLSGSFYKVIECNESDITGVIQKVKVISLGKQEAAVLNAQKKSPAFQVKCIGYSDGEALWYGKTIYRGDCWEIAAGENETI
ncbi:MAG: GntR family transcriptional regulator [Clostridiaceae bacterium]